ncbi:MAG: ferritin family protein [Armatimonadetes bacterium]|nr:ferritin family protein [Armatimonadota bacterium]
MEDSQAQAKLDVAAMTLAEALETALEFERRGRAYYRSGAARVKNDVIKAVLYALAHDEELHEGLIRRFYEAMQRSAGWPDVSKDLPPPLPARQRIEAIMQQTAGNLSEDPSYIDVYEHARELEAASRDFYRDLSEQAQDRELLKFLRFLAGMEQTHLEMLGLLLAATREEKEGREQGGHK